MAAFAGVVLFIWALAAGPAFALAGPWGVVGSGVAALLCLVPGLVILYGDERIWKTKSPLVRLGISTLLRLGAVFGGGSVLFFTVEKFTVHSLLVWLVVFYLVTLGLETGLILSPKDDRSSSHGRRIS